MKTDWCCWCDKPVKMPDNFNPGTMLAICRDPKCMTIQILFNLQYSDEAYNRRAHYSYLTRADDYGQS